MTDTRPDPDQLLAQVRASEARAHRGRLTIFFGANAGVGKTYAMLEAAQRRRAEGVDVAIGYVEMHGRAETERLLPGLEQLPPRLTALGEGLRREFNLDAALARKPQLLLVDELAHTNLGSELPPRHEKRWQDVEELLDAGIDVYTTVNVQHLESLSDVVAQITGVRQLETLPDRIFDEADEIKLVDLPPDDLLQRLREGRVYVTDQAQLAMENFFRKGNLIALRELALRKTADRVDQAMRDYRATRAVRGAWAARERLMVCVGPDDQAERLVRAGKRLADGLNAEWLVVYVETPDLLRLPEAERNRRIAVLRLAESLDAEAITLGGPTAAGEIMSYARTRNVTRLLVGAPRRRLQHWFRSSTTQTLIDADRDFEVSVIGAPLEGDAVRGERVRRGAIDAGPDDINNRKRWGRYLLAIGGVGMATALCMLLYPLLELANLVMIYLLATALVAVRGGRRAAVLCAVLSVLAFDFMFVPPRFTFAVSDAQYLVTFAIMLVVALIIGGLNANVRLQERVAGHRERRTALLYAMTRQLAASSGRDDMAQIAVRHVGEVFACHAVLLLPDPNGHIVHPRAAPLPESYRGAVLGIAQWVLDHGKPAGLGTDTLAGAQGVYLPVRGAQRTLAVLGVLPGNRRRVTLPEQFRLLETFGAQIGLALERAQLVGTAQAAEVRAQTEAIRNSLLASISHDLRTPLATIVGGAAALAGGQLGPADTRVIANSVAEEAAHMSERITTLLDLVRLESGAIRPRLDWYALDEVIGSAVRRVAERLRRHEIRVEQAELPPLHIDGRLIEQVLENLLDNASKYTPAGTEVVIRAVRLSRQVEVSVEDNGPGLGVTEPAVLFEKFHRGQPEGAVGGIGVGLSICRTIVGLHGGKIWAENRSPRGAAFRFTLPLSAETPPSPDLEQPATAPPAAMT